MLLDSFDLDNNWMTVVVAIGISFMIIAVITLLYFSVFHQPTETRNEAKQLIVCKEDLESIVNQHTSEPDLPDRKEELLEEWELDGITPTETDLQNHLKQNVAENLHRLRRNVESRWKLAE